jgi:N-acetylneuraminic acid mutarotase
MSEKRGSITSLNSIEVLNAHENTWTILSTEFDSGPTYQVSTIASTKDRIIILGGSDEVPSCRVREIDFIKRRSIFLESMKEHRCNPATFIINNYVYVFGGVEETG